MIALLGLAILWAIVLIPDLVRRGASARRSDSIGQFARHRSVLGRSAPVGVRRESVGGSVARLGSGTVVDLRGPRPVVTNGSRPMSSSPAGGGRSSDSFDSAAQTVRRSPTQQRRQDVLTALVAAALLSFLGFATFGGPMLMVHVVADVLLGAYVALWLTVTRRERIRAQVSYLYQPAPLGMVAARSERQRIAR